MALEIEPFVLPRLDWYDTDGRIYKDALIENFNAIEAKLQGLLAVEAFDVQEPNWDEISIPDTTLSSNDTAIVNVKSLVEIMGLDTFPVKADFSGVKLNEVKYYDTSNDLKSITGRNVSGVNSSKPIVILDRADGTIRASSDIGTLGSSEIIIGYFCTGLNVIVGAYHPIYSDKNALSVLWKLNYTPRSHEQGKKAYGRPVYSTITGNRVIGYARSARKGNYWVGGIMSDIGNKNKSNRT